MILNKYTIGHEKKLVKMILKSFCIIKKIVGLGGGIVLAGLVCIRSCTCQMRSEGSLLA